MCIAVVRSFDDTEDVREALKNIGIRFLGLGSSSEVKGMRGLLADFEKILAGDPPLACAQDILVELRKFVDEIENEIAVEKKPSLAELRHFFAQRAAELGIDLDDATDRIAEVIRVGLDDLDPTRIVKNCKHIHVVITSYGMPAEILGLHTAGSKRIICLKHGHSMEGLKLDSVYEYFSKVFPWDKSPIRCENCPDKWSSEWQESQHNIFEKAHWKKGDRSETAETDKRTRRDDGEVVSRD